MNIYEEFIRVMKQNNLTKEAVIDVLNHNVNGSNFLQRLEKFKNEEGERCEYHGIIYSDEYEQDEEEYLDKIKFYFILAKVTMITIL